MTEISIGHSQKFNVGESAAPVPGIKNSVDLESHVPAVEQIAEQKRVNFQVTKKRKTIIHKLFGSFKPRSHYSDSVAASN